MGKKSATAIPKAPVAQILMNAGAKRVSSDAVDTLVDVLLDKANDICTNAIRIARHSGRKTVQEGDIKLAAKM